MENFLINIAGKYAILLIPVLTGFFAAFIMEATMYYTPKWFTMKYVVLIISILISIPMAFAFPRLLPLTSDKIVIGITSVALSVIFHYSFGKKMVRLIIKKIEKKVEEQ